jgi:tetratricopeptide (TPR) repeat protein
LDYYQQLVLLAQNEIAATLYELGNYAEAATALDRLLKLDSVSFNRTNLQYRYLHCLVSLGRHAEAVALAQDFLDRYPVAPERPEVRFLCAASLKAANRNPEALRQVLDLLKEQHTGPAPDPQTLAYWQRRAGNEIANRFYLEGDAAKALDIYVCLAALDRSPEWQLPVWYQIGLLLEKLGEPAKAVEYFGNVIAREKEVPGDAQASLKMVLELSRWRKDYLSWQLKTEQASQALHSTLASSPKPNANN